MQTGFSYRTTDARKISSKSHGNKGRLYMMAPSESRTDLRTQTRFQEEPTLVPRVLELFGQRPERLWYPLV